MQMLQRCEAFIIDNIEGRRTNKGFCLLLYMTSLLYKGVSFVRHYLYDLGIFRSYQMKCPVISVGNIVAGGTGKTPFVAKLLQKLDVRPGQIAILSRGYRSSREMKVSQIASGSGPNCSVLECGDEPYWLALNTTASLWVGQDRVSAAKLAQKKGAKVLLLDDGFQHRRLKRDIDIVLLDGQDLWGKGYFLPRGYLRDSPKKLAKADYVVVTHLEQVTQDQWEVLVSEIALYTKAPVIGFAASYSFSPPIAPGKIGAFCGIAKPDNFYRALAQKEKNCEVVSWLTTQDHKVPSIEEIKEFALLSKGKGAQALICTEKDFVKLTEIDTVELPIHTLVMDIECVQNEKSWKEMIGSIQNRT